MKQVKHIKPYLFTAIFCNALTNIGVIQLRKNFKQNDENFVDAIINSLFASTAPALTANLINYLGISQLTDDSAMRNIDCVLISVLLTPLAPSIRYGNLVQKYESFLLNWDDKLYLKPHLLNSATQFLIYNHLIERDLAKFNEEEYESTWFDKVIDFLS